MTEAVIVGAARTAIGSFGGGLASVSGPKLGATAIRGALERSGVKAEDVNEVIMGCVLFSWSTGIQVLWFTSSVWSQQGLLAPCDVFDPWVRWERGQVGI